MGLLKRLFRKIRFIKGKRRRMTRAGPTIAAFGQTDFLSGAGLLKADAAGPAFYGLQGGRSHQNAAVRAKYLPGDERGVVP